MKKYQCEKSGKKSKKVEKIYVNQPHKAGHFFAKNEAVEKLVESVEKSITPTEKHKNRTAFRREKIYFFNKNTS